MYDVAIAMNSSNPPAPSLSACMHLIMLLCMSGSPTTTHEWRNARSPCKNKEKRKNPFQHPPAQTPPGKRTPPRPLSFYSWEILDLKPVLR
ncbi:hypothetical protein I7I50_03133 [Histoplasma capsulatum G186AR]|uniref:Uncharacterized protein n=1 Tax=Ajellomyces capsulatus TaxID=5037 RepID=A0A8H8D7G4_AJECA|nr:hypothetical protein I7I52_00198 [Histoplasma capsulatum]QSS72077.1 hypothetical protein I7I50_03133 [Histoplasma capsulatum G186AR]